MTAEILIVEDDAAIRQVLCEILEDEGYRVAATAHGQEALAYLHAAPVHPCLILLDLLMPVMNGYAFRTAQQQEPRLAQIPVVVLTARSLAPEATATLQIGCSLAKPIVLPELLTLVASYCR
ncbi:MAG TPA: response regulator [Herpetosiphonaceae bacterium]